ncbi:DUF551 domain-containing protein [Enterobacter hormaechei]|uniref:DUF551 domain-containing protein n=1 Tax=Enterobacter hormaechei TaxID=158836 RepID=UPI001E4F72C5|nr:DUF551 domain-containing protein [Enterobacter hormaechei]
MSTITKEQAQSVSDLKAGYTLGHADVTILNELARIALASLEAEAVAWIIEGGKGDTPCHLSTRKEYAEAYPDRKVTPLYTAPPAPVSVPDAIHSQGEKSASDDYYALGWNACRAAMLKHSEPFIVTSDHRMMEMPQVEAINAVTAILQGAEPVTTAYKLPDGWVACSERMPEESGRYWCYVEEQNDLGKSHYQWNCSWNGDRWWVESENGGRVTHWMPLPAAPQQEVK